MEQPSDTDPIREVVPVLLLKVTAHTTDPYRIVTQYFTLDGKPVFRLDPAFPELHELWKEKQDLKHRIECLSKIPQLDGVRLQWVMDTDKWRVVPHPDLERLEDVEPGLFALLNEFRLEMGKDLVRAYEDGKCGWDSEEDREYFLGQIHDHVKRGRYIGAANFCMFLHHLDKQKREEAGESDGDSGV